MAKSKKIDLLKQELDLYLSNPSLVMMQKGWTKKEFDSYITDLSQKIELSKRGKSSKRKGGNYERVVAKHFQKHLGVELKRTPMSGGFAKDSKKAEDFRGDIVSLDESIDFQLHIECKDHSTWSLPAWIKQSEGDCPKGKIPVVVMHRRQKVTNGKVSQEAGDYVTLRLEDFLSIVNPEKIILPKSKRVTVPRRIKR